MLFVIQIFLNGGFCVNQKLLTCLRGRQLLSNSFIKEQCSFMSSHPPTKEQNLNKLCDRFVSLLVWKEEWRGIQFTYLFLFTIYFGLHIRGCLCMKSATFGPFQTPQPPFLKVDPLHLQVYQLILFKGKVGLLQN